MPEICDNENLQQPSRLKIRLNALSSVSHVTKPFIVSINLSFLSLYYWILQLFKSPSFFSQRFACFTSTRFIGFEVYLCYKKYQYGFFIFLSNGNKITQLKNMIFQKNLLLRNTKRIKRSWNMVKLISIRC